MTSEVNSIPSVPSVGVPRTSAFLLGSASVFGSRQLPSETIDRAFGMPIGKLRDRAGIESLAYATEDETEVSLGSVAAQQALQSSYTAPSEIDWIVATSETHHTIPSLAAQLHSALGVREDCAALDVGGACLGLLNALAVAQSLLVAGSAKTIAVITADVHSRALTPGRVAGEFGGLFGDGASAFILKHSGTAAGVKSPVYELGAFIFGCASQYSGAVTVVDTLDGKLDVHFDGEALSRAAIARLEKVFASIEKRSGISRSQVGAFATHQPNPRLVNLLAKVAAVCPDAFPPIAQTRGNLGSSTCGAALHAAVKMAAACSPTERKPIFLASLGPGLLFGGAWLSPGKP